MMMLQDVSSLVKHITLNIENEWELGLHKAKNTDYMEKRFK